MSAESDRRPTRRFADRVDYYVRYRPGYPAALTELFRSELGMRPGQVVADVGSGTGKLTEMLLDEGLVVWAVEPNAEMREAAERALGGRPGFLSVAGSAEATGLADAAVGHVVAAQAFHWFRIDETRAEFGRILRPGASVALIWNRRTTRSPFLRAYEALLRRASIDYPAVDHRKTTDSGVLDAFFEPGGGRRACFPYEQRLTWDGLLGRALSSSYVPLPGQAGHDRLVRELRRIFDEHRDGDEVRFEYDTEVFWGRPRVDCPETGAERAIDP